ncbi:MAG: T9SS type A sorting domain-containing protein [bacterium]|nr:T9SS type A sorting domain-containing protein [bacterium]
MLKIKLSMPGIIPLVLISTITANMGCYVFADTTYVSTDITSNTIWTKSESPYFITNDISIDNSITLNIEPGTKILIGDSKQLTIIGDLYAIGTATDSITITAQDTTKRWENILVKSTAKCSLQYCKIEYAGNSAISNMNSNSVYILNNTISNNTTELCGGGIYNNGSSIITNNTISHNTAKYGGGAIFNSKTTTITNNTISYNTNTDTTAVGGGIWNNYKGTAYITGNTLYHNTSMYNGGAIFNEGTAFITYDTISSNSTTVNWGSGAGICNKSSAEITNNVISYNTANYGIGGGIHNYSGTATVRNNSIFFNTAKYNGGGLSNENSINVFNNDILHNTTNGNGGGIYNYNLAVIESNFVYANNADYNGGGIYNYKTLTSRNNGISGNSAQKGGGIYNSSGFAVIEKDSIFENIAESGGGIYNCDTTVIKNNSIINNSAQYGGAIYDYETAIIKFNSIVDTTASAIYNTGKTFIRENNIHATGYFVYNNASDWINAAYNYWNTADTTVMKTKIYDYYDNTGKGIVFYKPFLYSEFKDTVPPDAPTNLTVKPLSKTSYIINWTNPFDSSGISEYYYKLNSKPKSDFDTTKTLRFLSDTLSVTTKDTLIYIWLGDSSGNVDCDNSGHAYIRYDTIPPVISNTAILEDTTGFIEITTKISDNFLVYAPVLSYKTSTDTNWTYKTMGYFANSFYTDTIPPQTVVDSLQIEYYITVMDYADNHSRDPDSGTYSFFVYPPAVEENKTLPIKFALFSPTPNPGSAKINIKYGIPEKASINLNVYDILGRLVIPVYKGTQEKGLYTIELKNKLRKGVYFVVFNANNFKQVQKMIISQ